MSTPAEVAEIILHHRQHKARKLVDALIAHGYSLDLAKSLTDHGWHIVALSAGTKVPSPDTKELVYQLLEAQLAKTSRD